MTSLTTRAGLPTAPASPVWPAAQRWGGLAALVIAATYVVGFLGMGVYLVPAGFTDAAADPAASLEFLLGHQISLYLWYLVLYLVGGAALVVLALGVHERVARSQPALAMVTTGFGLIWAGHLLASGMVALLGQQAVVQLAASRRDRAESTWVTLSAVQDALGGGIELVGALWLLLISTAALRARTFSRRVAVLGLVVGVAGVATLAPASAQGATAIFGLGLIVWFLATGLELTRGARSPRAV
jgi:hypothetical protein